MMPRCHHSGLTLGGEVWEGTDDFWRLGAGVQWQYKDLTLAAAYVGGSNDNPYGDLSPDPKALLDGVRHARSSREEA